MGLEIVLDRTERPVGCSDFLLKLITREMPPRHRLFEVFVDRLSVTFCRAECDPRGTKVQSPSLFRGVPIEEVSSGVVLPILRTASLIPRRVVSSPSTSLRSSQNVMRTLEAPKKTYCAYIICCCRSHSLRKVPMHPYSHETIPRLTKTGL